jgi:flavin reductase (DIM6/NTAB) family NADH-FMN oxidoreductase RutF
MARQTKSDFTLHYDAVMDAMTSRGLLLGSYDAERRANVMTIGWGSLGSVWGMPIWLVMVRPSRYSYRCIQHTGCFTVNVPPDSLGYACAKAGSVSGAEEDKFALAGLTPRRAGSVLAPLVEGCPIQYECQVVHSNDVLPEKLSDELLSGPYVNGDYHRVYWGRVLAVHVAPDAAEVLQA